MNVDNQSMQDPSKVIKAYPTKDLFISMLVRDITVRDAIGDLLDNSVDGALRMRPNGDFSGLKVEIQLNQEEGYFEIADNCGGIPVSIAREYAFRFGRPEGRVESGGFVGVFGIGMKRALFRLGQEFIISSIAADSRFDMTVDVKKWAKELDESGDPKEWQFSFGSVEENLKPQIPENGRGTVIRVTKLRDEVIDLCRFPREQAILVEELQREHLYSINSGLRITVNQKRLHAPKLELLTSNQLRTAYWESLDSPVKVKIYAGISSAQTDQHGPSGGWYIFCNKRLVLGPDQTKNTGWGVKKPIRIPEYHSQFYRFRGYVFMDAEDPRNLPWNTAKTAMDLDSPVYKAVLQQMIMMMRTVIDFLNKVHKEEQDYEQDRITSQPLHAAIENAVNMPLEVVRSTESHLANERFEAPPPAKPAKPAPPVVRVCFSVPPEIYEQLKAYFETDRSDEIGRQVFEYFYERELDQ